MSSLTCAISGVVPLEPVVSKTGYLFEKRLIENYIIENGRCPMTGDSCTLAELRPVFVNPAVIPRLSQTSNIPSLMSMLQTEWDTLMLETFNLKSTLHQTREQLAHALYQYEAALRVIARLSNERDEALSQRRPVQTSIEISLDAPQSSDAISTRLPDDLAEMVSTMAASLMQNRRKRKFPNTVSREEISRFSTPSKVDSLQCSVASVAVHPQDPGLLFLGGNEGVIYSLTDNLKVGHFAVQSEISSSAFHPNEGQILTGSVSGDVINWVPDEQQEGSWKVSHRISFSTSPIRGISFHPSGECVLVVAEDGKWALIEPGNLNYLSAGEISEKISCAYFHPDGGMFAVATPSKVVLFKTVDGEPAGVEISESSLTQFRFAENGFLLVTVSSARAKVWDLRKPGNFIYQVRLDVIDAVFDDSCQYFAVLSSNGYSIHSMIEKNKFEQTVTHELKDGRALHWLADSRGLVIVDINGAIKLICNR